MVEHDLARKRIRLDGADVRFVFLIHDLRKALEARHAVLQLLEDVYEPVDGL